MGKNSVTLHRKWLLVASDIFSVKRTFLRWKAPSEGSCFHDTPFSTRGNATPSQRFWLKLLDLSSEHGGERFIKILRFLGVVWENINEISSLLSGRQFVCKSAIYQWTIFNVTIWETTNKGNFVIFLLSCPCLSRLFVYFLRRKL